MSPIHIPTLYFFKIHFNTILPFTPRSPKWSLFVRFSNENFIRVSFSHMLSAIRATCLVHLNLLAFITRVIVGKEYKLWSYNSMLCSFCLYLASTYFPRNFVTDYIYEGIPKSFRTGRVEQELQMVQLSATTCTCTAILWVSLVSFAAITLCVASQRAFIVVSAKFFIDSVRKLLDTPSYTQE